MDIYLENGGVAPTLHTQRLTLRALNRSDCDPVVAALSDWSVTRWLTSVPFPYAVADFDHFIDHIIPETHHLVWAIDAGTGLIGAVSVKSELGYWLAPAQHGQGFMTEAATAAIDWYFQHASDDLASGYIVGNTPSQHVLRKLGFTPTHVKADETTARGETVTVQRLVLSQTNWTARHV